MYMLDLVILLTEEQVSILDPCTDMSLHEVLCTSPYHLIGMVSQVFNQLLSLALQKVLFGPWVNGKEFVHELDQVWGKVLVDQFVLELLNGHRYDSLIVDIDKFACVTLSD